MPPTDFIAASMFSSLAAFRFHRCPVGSSDWSLNCFGPLARVPIAGATYSPAARNPRENRKFAAAPSPNVAASFPIVSVYCVGSFCTIASAFCLAMFPTPPAAVSARAGIASLLPIRIALEAVTIPAAALSPAPANACPGPNINAPMSTRPPVTSEAPAILVGICNTLRSMVLGLSSEKRLSCAPMSPK